MNPWTWEAENKQTLGWTAIAQGRTINNSNAREKEVKEHGGASGN
jgi:hypothetical protein